MRDELQNAVRLARAAGQRIMPFYQTALNVRAKDDKSPLTDADMASHHYLVGALSGAPVVSEESADKTVPSGKFWLVDPLDGTKEFLKGTNEFTVNIALVENGRAVMGVVHAPALNLTYYAASGFGAWRQKGKDAPQPIAARKADLANWAIVASKDHAGPMVAALLQKFPAAALRFMGSSLKFCLVAEGSADIYLRDVPTMEWDTAAAQCVVESAGGAVCLLDGTRLGYGKETWKNPSIVTLGDPAFRLPPELSPAS